MPRKLRLIVRGIPPRGRFTISRRLLQATILVLFATQLLVAGAVIEGSLASARILREIPLLDPFAWIEQAIATRAPTLESVIAVAVVVGIYSVLGRFFCGWVCPMDLLFSVFERKLANPRGPRLSRPHMLGGLERRIPIVFMAVYMLLSLILGWPFFTTFSPVAGTTKFTSILVGVVYNIPGAAIGLALAWAATTVFALAVNIVAERVFGVKRFWCRYVCPIGAFYGYTVNRYSLLRVSVRAPERCRGCNLCGLVCPMSIDVLGYVRTADSVRDPRCFNCGRCVEACPHGVLGLSLGRKLHKRGAG